MTETIPTLRTDPNKFMRTIPIWFTWVRNPVFIGVTFALLTAYAVLLLPGLPEKGVKPTWAYYASLAFFITAILAWTANILADRDKSELLKGVVAFGLIGVIGWLFYRYSGAQWDKLISSFFAVERMTGNWWILWGGLRTTLMLAAISAVFSVLVGLIVAILRFYNHPTINIFLIAYIDVFRSMPMIVIMVVLFFALPYLGINLGSIMATVVALSLGYGAYAAEAFRAGIEAVHTGQIEASRSLGLSRMQTIRMIILPQAIPIVIPPLTGILISMLKDTAVASVVAAPELLKRARELYTRSTSPTPLVAAAAMYLMVIIPLVRILNILESKVKGAK